MLRRLAAALITTGATVLAALAVPGTAAAATTPTTVWQWNIAGNTMHHGSTTDGLIPAATSSIVHRNAQFVGINELCHQQYTALVTSLRAAGFPQDPGNFARFEPSTPGGQSSICAGQQYGIGLFSAAPLGTARRYALPDARHPNETRKLLCAPLAARPHLVYCTTHLVPDDAYLQPQLDAVRSRIDGFRAAGDTVLISGDFNAQPNSARLNGWYSSSVDTPANRDNTGRYRELDDTDGGCPGYGEWTFGSTGGPCGLGTKLDLLFVREDTVAGAYQEDSLAVPTTCGGPCSDHRAIVGTVPVTVAG